MNADAPAFWQLATLAEWQLHKHYFLMPNPYPNSRHLCRRWHAHPSFPLVPLLGGDIEVRSNWLSYLTEFAQAAEVLGQAPGQAALRPKDSQSQSAGAYTHPAAITEMKHEETAAPGAPPGELVLSPYERQLVGVEKLFKLVICQGGRSGGVPQPGRRRRASGSGSGSGSKQVNVNA